MEENKNNLKINETEKKKTAPNKAEIIKKQKARAETSKFKSKYFGKVSKEDKSNYSFQMKYNCTYRLPS